MASLAFWFVFGTILVSLFLFWAAISAIMGSFILHDQDEEERTFMEDREWMDKCNRDAMVYYLARTEGLTKDESDAILFPMNLGFQASMEELIEYVERHRKLSNDFWRQGDD